MLPYWKLQLIYALAAGIACGGAWWLAGRGLRPPAATRPLRRRAVVAGALVLLPLALWWYAVRVLDEPHTTFQFTPISWAFYALTLWFPALVLGATARGRSRGQRVDGLFVTGALAALLIGADALLIEPNRLQTVEHEVTLEAWPVEAAPLRLVHISDLQSVGSCEREREAVRRINALEPDLIVVTGDYAAGPFNEPEPAIEAARTFLSGLRARLGVIVVAGHSENAATRARIFEGLDLSVLHNETELLELDDGRELRVFGVPARGMDLGALEPRTEPGLATLVASHVPDVSAELDGRGVDLHLAGHTHGGQIALPLYGPPMTLSSLPRRFARGLHDFGDHRLHVSPGIGMEGNHAPRIRFLCPPEINLLLLVGGDADGSSGPSGP